MVDARKPLEKSTLHDATSRKEQRCFSLVREHQLLGLEDWYIYYNIFILKIQKKKQLYKNYTFTPIFSRTSSIFFEATVFALALPDFSMASALGISFSNSFLLSRIGTINFSISSINISFNSLYFPALLSYNGRSSVAGRKRLCMA